MALYPMIRSIILILLLAAICGGQALACYGPKIHVAFKQEPKQQLMYEMVRLYLHEKTGIETIEVEKGKVETALVEDRADLIFLPSSDRSDRIDILPDLTLVPGERLQSDLQFTTALPALRKLARLLDSDLFAQVETEIKNGEPIKKAVRNFLFSNGWI